MRKIKYKFYGLYSPKDVCKINQMKYPNAVYCAHDGSKRIRFCHYRKQKSVSHSDFCIYYGTALQNKISSSQFKYISIENSNLDS